MEAQIIGPGRQGGAKGHAAGAPLGFGWALALEFGGRFGLELVDFVRQIAAARAERVPSFLRSASAAAMERRWTRVNALVRQQA